jgi:hypothetical protein
MRRSSRARLRVQEDAKQVSAKHEGSTPHISGAVRSWVKNVIAPALVKAYLAEQALRRGQARA